MSILDVLKRIKLPNFGNDLIQDELEKAIEDAQVSSGRKVVYAPRQDSEMEGEVDDLEEWMRRNNTPGDPQYIPLISDED
jgi:hypothetical protein